MNGRWPDIGIARPAGGGGGPWTPSDDPGLVAWWDATDAASFTLLAGNKFSRWRARNNAAIYIEQTTSANQAVYTGSWIVIANSVPRYAMINAPAVQGACVMTLSNVQETFACLFARGAYAPAFYLCGESNDFQRYGAGSYGSNSGLAIGSGRTLVTLPTFCQVGAISYKDGTASGTFAGTTWGASPPDKMLWDGDQARNGEVHEIIISSSSDVATRQKYEGYLAHKAGLAGKLPAGHPFKAAPPTT